MTEAPKLYRINDAARALAVSRATLYRLIKNGRLKTVCIGTVQRVTAASVDELISASEKGKSN
jgi:excisionase family DNA binding protein